MKFIGSHNMCYFLKYYGRRLNWPESGTIAKVFVRSSSVICLQIFIFILKFSAAEYKNFPIPSFFIWRLVWKAFFVLASALLFDEEIPQRSAQTPTIYQERGRLAQMQLVLPRMRGWDTFSCIWSGLEFWVSIFSVCWYSRVSISMVSANEYSCAHGTLINFGDLTPYLTNALTVLYTKYRYTWWLPRGARWDKRFPTPAPESENIIISRNFSTKKFITEARF